MVAFRFRCFGLALAIVLTACFSNMARGATVEDAWAGIVALDAGPSLSHGSSEQVRVSSIAHLDRQERALRSFLSTYPTDAHGFEASLRLARLLQIRADLKGTPTAISEATQILDQLEKSSTPEQKAEVAFARLTMLMRTLRAPTDEKRERLLKAVRSFQAAYPADRRLGALLAEIATLFQSQPKKMRALLVEAQPLVRDPELNSRVMDDLKRLDLMGHVVKIQGTDLNGNRVDLEHSRGSVVALCFFALWSQPSLGALETLKRATTEVPKGSLQIICFNLDLKPEPVAAFCKERAISWPVISDGKGWESPLVRSLGINALPTVWLLDRQGRLRSIAGIEATVSQVRQLSHERGN